MYHNTTKEKLLKDDYEESNVLDETNQTIELLNKFNRSEEDIREGRLTPLSGIKKTIWLMQQINEGIDDLNNGKYMTLEEAKSKLL